MTNLICIVCPKGWHLAVDEDNNYEVTGFGCARGVDYGKKELTNPTRVITSTVKIAGGIHKRLPVKTDKDIPKGMIQDAMKLLDSVELTAPVKVGDVVVPDICGTGAAWVASRDM